MSRIRHDYGRFNRHLPWFSSFVLLFALAFILPASQFLKQQWRGTPLDIHYLHTEWSWQNALGLGYYNGSGGSDWKIGEPVADFGSGFWPRSLAEVRATALQLVNRDRTLNGRPPLRADDRLMRIAQIHAEDMLKHHYFAHRSPAGTMPRDRFLAIGGSAQTRIGENIIYVEERGLEHTFGDVENFEKYWMYSNGHRHNILTEDFVRFGYGVAVDPLSGRKYAVQTFADTEPTP